MTEKGLIVSGVGRRFPAKRGSVVAVTDADLALRPGERLALVGESGSGKSTLVRMMLALDRPTTGTVTLDGTPVIPGSAHKLRWFRRRVQYIPQDPATSLNPHRRTVELVAEPLRLLGVDGDHRDRAEQALDTVGLGGRFLDRRPTELSGGQNQRVAIARAVACAPDYLLADEPASGLDVGLREQIIDVLHALNATRSTALMVVTHDLAVAARLCEQIVVMFSGRLVECGSVADVLTRPTHPHTRDLIESIPRLPTPVGEPAVPR
ncbi:MAG: ABC transporter ATP-binding protein [Gordonia sp. (in: high G+C Gram-positive bacteria)]